MIAAVLVAGCDAATSPTASPTAAPTTPPASVDQAAIYAAIEREVEAIRELTPTRSVDPVLLDADALRRTLAEASADESSPDALARRGRLLIALGLLPAGADLVALTTAFQNGQIAGFYRPEDGRLYVVSRGGGLGPVEKTTFAHEYTHALQDQHFPLLDQLGVDKVPHGDQDLGQLALIEGDATLSMTYWAQKHLSTMELLQLLGSSLDPGQLEALNAMPAFMRDTALFPYQAGLQFVTQLQVAGWLGGRRRRLRHAAGLDGADPSPRQIPGPRGTGQRDVARRPREGDGPGLVGRLRGHAGRVPARRLADRCRRSQAVGPAGDRGRGRRQQAGVATASPSCRGRPARGAWSSAPPGTATADASQFFDAAGTAVQHAGPAGQAIRVKNPREIWVVLGSDPATVTTIEGGGRVLRG